MRTAPEFNSIEDIAAYHERELGGHFFDPSEMRMFGSKVYPDIYPGRDGWPIFITSERQPAFHSGPHPRLYTVRQLKPTGGVPPISFPPRVYMFQAFHSLRGARAFAARESYRQVGATS